MRECVRVTTIVKSVCENDSDKLRVCERVIVMVESVCESGSDS